MCCETDHVNQVCSFVSYNLVLNGTLLLIWSCSCLMKDLAKASCLESVLIPALALELTGVTVSCRWNCRDRCFRLKEDLEGHAGTCWPSCGPLPLGSTVLTNPRLLMNMEARHLQLSPHRPTWSIWLGWGWRDGPFRSADCWQSPRLSDKVTCWQFPKCAEHRDLLANLKLVPLIKDCQLLANVHLLCLNCARICVR